MNIIELLVEEKIADNAFHAAGMLNVLRCGELATDEERLERCRLYKAWKLAGEKKPIARQNAIKGIPAPMQMFEDFIEDDDDDEVHSDNCTCESCLQNNPERDILYGDGEYFDWGKEEDNVPRS